MDTTTTAATIAGPIGSLGAGFYFSPTSQPIADAIGINTGLLYGAGRGGMIADASVEEIEEIFYFFKTGFIAGLVNGGRTSASEADIMAAHLQSITDYAEAHFVGVDADVLSAFAAAAEAVVEAVPTAHYPIFDGYAAVTAPESLVAAAYLAVVQLRELRGGVHTDAVKDGGMAPQTACQFDGTEYSYPMHGWGEEEKVEATDEILALRARIEGATTAKMAEYLAPLGDAQRQALVDGALAMQAALS